MEEYPLPQEVVATVDRLTEEDFTAIRTDPDIDFAFIDEVEVINPSDINSETIEAFKESLLRMYLPYYAEKMHSFLALKPDYFIVDGTSAIPYAYLFKEAYAEYARLHLEETVTPPHFLFFDIHPLKIKIQYMKREEALSYIVNLTDEDITQLWGNIGAERVRNALKMLMENPGKTILFDEFSDPNSDHVGSLTVLNHLLTQRIPAIQTTLESPAIGMDDHKLSKGGKTFWQVGLIASYHAYRAIKRRGQGSGELRRPSPTDHPIAHERALELIHECQQLGRLIANAA